MKFNNIAHRAGVIPRQKGWVRDMNGYELVKEALFKEANIVSKKLEAEPSNKKLLGAWEALTAVMDNSALLDEYNELRS